MARWCSCGPAAQTQKTVRKPYDAERRKQWVRVAELAEGGKAELGGGVPGARVSSGDVLREKSANRVA